MVKPCIYCLSSDGPFTAVEHIVPEAIGNASMILPRGTVCNPCNNGPLALLDSALASLDEVHLARAVLRVEGKRGAKGYKREGVRVAHSREGSTTMSWQASEGALCGEANDPAALISPDQAERLSRALLKILLGVLCLRMGRKLVLGPMFNPLRERILGRELYPGVFMMVRRTELRPAAASLPEPEVDYHFLEDHIGPPVEVWADLLGVRVGTYYEVGTRMYRDAVIASPPPELLVLGFRSSLASGAARA